MKPVYFVAFILVSWISVVSTLEPCPAIELTGNLTDDSVIQANVRKVLKQVWAKPWIVPESPLIKKFREIFVQITTSESYYLNRIGAKFAIFSRGLFKHIGDRYPSFCIFAEAINKSVEWEKSRDVNKQLDTVKLLPRAIEYILSALKYGILEEICCKGKISDPLDGSRNCFDNGFTVKMEQAWSMFGTLIPWPMYNIIQKLYQSSIFSERAVAVMFTYVLTPAVEGSRALWTDGNIAIPLQLYSIFDQAGSPAYKKCDCKSSVENLTNTMQEKIDIQAEKDIEEISKSCE